MRWWIILALVCGSAGLMSGCSSGPHLPKPRPADDDEPAPQAQAPAAPPQPVAPKPAAIAAVPVAAIVTPSPTNTTTVTPSTAAAAAPTAPAPVAAAPADTNLSEVDRRKRIINQLREISKALEAYRERNGSYPPRAVSGKGLSWRVLLLPFLGKRDLYLKFRLGEPWDSPANQTLLAEMPEVYRSLEHQDGRTNLQFVTGAEMAYATNDGVGENCRDGFENTIFLVEVSDELARPWTAPADYEFARATAQRDLFSLRQDCCFAILGGTSGPRRIKANISDQNLLALLTPAGGEKVALSETAVYAYPEVEQDLIAVLAQSPLVRFSAKGAPPAPEAAANRPVAAGAAAASKSPLVEVKPTENATAAASIASLPLPNEKELAQAAARAKEIFGDDYAAAKRPDQKRAFAQKLMTEAEKIKADPIGAFVLYRTAKDVAARAGDVQTALTASDKMAALYRVDLLAVKSKALEQAAPLVTDADQSRLSDAALELVEGALKKDDFTTATFLLTLAGGAAKQADASDRLAHIAAKQEELQQVRTAYARVSTQVHALLRDANDPAANTAVGKYCCFIKRDWERGLDLLAKSSDERLTQLAHREQAKPTTAEAQVELADAWWDFAEDQRTDIERASIRQHAAIWYEKALPNLAASLAKARVERRIAQAKDDAPVLRSAQSRVPR